MEVEEGGLLNVKTFLDYICDDFQDSPIYLPINTVTPSEQLDGLPLAAERRFRAFACQLIQEAGILLRLPQIAVATAQAILHRFYFRKSFIRCEMVTVATAALFIAAKVEESPRKIKDVLTVTDYVIKLKKGERDVLDISSFHYTDTKQEIFEAERYILKEIGFATEALSESNVHQYLYFYLRDVLKGSKQLA